MPIILSQDIYDASMEHRLPPRTKLTEQMLYPIYDTARHTVRKVLTRLATEGMVDLEANRGAFIASPSNLEVKEMFELRNIIEYAVLDKVSREANTRQIAGLRKMVEEERQSYLSGDRPRWIGLSAQFHLALTEAIPCWSRHCANWSRAPHADPATYGTSFALV